MQPGIRESTAPAPAPPRRCARRADAPDPVPMRPAVRAGLVVLGAAMVVYRVASVTGCWLGMPPWWPQVRDPSGWFRRHPELWGEGREWIGLSLAIVGLALMVAAWPRRQRPPAAPPRLAASTPRVVGLFLGSVLAIYAVASLTGAWLGEPPRWRTHTPPAEVQEFWARARQHWFGHAKVDPNVARERSRAIEEERARLRESNPGDPAFRMDGSTLYVRPGRAWVSGGVAAVGIALVAVGSWPRRRSGGAP